MSSQIDSSIPVLTEVIKTEVSATAIPAPKADIAPAQIERVVDALFAKPHNSQADRAIVNEAMQNAVTMTEAVSASTQAIDEIKSEVKRETQNETQSESAPEAQAQLRSEDDWKQLENTLKENILRQVLARVDFVLEHKIRNSLAEILQVSVDKLASDIQFGLKNSLEDVVTRAVTQEIAKAKNNNIVRT